MKLYQWGLLLACVALVIFILYTYGVFSVSVDMDAAERAAADAAAALLAADQAAMDAADALLAADQLAADQSTADAAAQAAAVAQAASDAAAQAASAAAAAQASSDTASAEQAAANAAAALVLANEAAVAAAAAAEQASQQAAADAAATEPLTGVYTMTRVDGAKISKEGIHELAASKNVRLASLEEVKASRLWTCVPSIMVNSKKFVFGGHNGCYAGVANGNGSFKWANQANGVVIQEFPAMIVYGAQKAAPTDGEYNFGEFHAQAPLLKV
jgi:hypothetical protein